jgi:hypothetical protein
MSSIAKIDLKQIYYISQKCDIIFITFEVKEL